MELAGVVQKKVAQATVKPAWLEALTKELASVKPRLAASCKENANFCWGSHSVAKGASMAEDDVSGVLMAVSGWRTNTTKWKFSTISSKLRDILRQLLT